MIFFLPIQRKAKCDNIGKTLGNSLFFMLIIFTQASNRSALLIFLCYYGKYFMLRNGKHIPKIPG